MTTAPRITARCVFRLFSQRVAPVVRGVLFYLIKVFDSRGVPYYSFTVINNKQLSR